MDQDNSQPRLYDTVRRDALRLLQSDRTNMELYGVRELILVGLELCRETDRERFAGDLVALYFLGATYNAFGRYAEAEETANQALRLNPNERWKAHIYYLLGHLHLDQGDLDTAIDEWEKALAFNPDRPFVKKEILPALKRKAIEHLRHNQPDEARTFLSRMIELNEHDSDPYIGLACVAYQQGDPNRAESFLRIAFRNITRATDPESLENLGDLITAITGRPASDVLREWSAEDTKPTTDGGQQHPPAPAA